MNARTKKLERDMLKLRTSLKNVDWSTRVDNTWQLMKECIDENEKCLDLFEKKWEDFLLKRIKELDEWRQRHYN
jgi:hypothetical protein